MLTWDLRWVARCDCPGHGAISGSIIRIRFRVRRLRQISPTVCEASSVWDTGQQAVGAPNELDDPAYLIAL